MSDGNGLPLKIELTGGNVHDSVPAIDLLNDIKTNSLLGDKGYDSSKIVDFIESKGLKALIPSRISNKVHRKYDEIKYKGRYLIECFFSKIKHFRRIATRYEKLAENYKSMVLLGFIMS